MTETTTSTICPDCGRPTYATTEPDLAGRTVRRFRHEDTERLGCDVSDGREGEPHRYDVSIDGAHFLGCDDFAPVERTIDAALRRGRSDSVEVIDNETGEATTYRIERRIDVERRSTVRGDDRRAR